MPIATYRARLASARDALLMARAATGSARAEAVASAQRTLRTTDHITIAGATYAVDDAATAADLAATDGSIEDGIARIETLLALAPSDRAPAVDAERADARLHEIVRTGTPQGANLLDVLGQLLLRFLSGLRGPRLDPGVLVTAVALLGVALILFIVATLGRAVPERVRREVFVPLTTAAARPDAASQLRAADEALAAGRARDAIRALFLYVLSALTAREILRDDPALTDAELLARAAAIPHAESLGALVAIYERAWFGLREPTPDEAMRARALALRVAP